MRLLLLVKGRYNWKEQPAAQTIETREKLLCNWSVNPEDQLPLDSHFGSTVSLFFPCIRACLSMPFVCHSLPSQSVSQNTDWNFWLAGYARQWIKELRREREREKERRGKNFPKTILCYASLLRQSEFSHLPSPRVPNLLSVKLMQGNNLYLHIIMKT